MKRITIESKIDEILTRGVSEVIDKHNLKRKLLSGKKIRVKLGIDPTSPNLHLGRSVVLLKLKDFQELGHKVVFIIGDFTGVIGDTSDKESERPMLDANTIKKNLATYKKQLAKILDIKKVEIKYNSQWLSKLGYNEIGEQANQFSLAEFTARENIKKRLDKGTRVSLREVLYPLMQGYDSVTVKSDLELGATDQRFNLLAGRELQRHFGQEPQDVLMVNLIEGLDGRKMSSSWGNTINLLDDPNTMFGKVMSMGDELIVEYFIHCTRVPMEKVYEIKDAMRSGELNPRDAKLQLAHEIVNMYHGEKKSDKAREYFVSAFSKKEIPKDIPEVKVKPGMKLTEFLVVSGNAKSMSDSRRKIEQGGVEMNNEKVSDWKMILDKSHENSVLKIGKFGFARIRIERK